MKSADCEWADCGLPTLVYYFLFFIFSATEHEIIIIERERPECSEQSCQTDPVDMAYESERLALEAKLKLHPLHVKEGLPISIIRHLPSLTLEECFGEIEKDSIISRPRVVRKGRVFST